MKDDISIVGAGPAGLTAAIVLAGHGLKVRVYDMSPDVGHRLNGDFQGLENWSSEKDITELLRQIGIRINFLCVPYTCGIVYAPGRGPAKVDSGRPIFYLVKRGPLQGTLDAGLKEQALAAGVEIIFNRRFDGPDEVTGSTIIATGPKGVDMAALGVTFETNAEDRAIVAFGDDVAPKGYSYLLIHKGYGTLATVLFGGYRKGSECFENMLRFYGERVHIDMKHEQRFTSYGNFFISDTLVQDRRLYIGEAAGFQDFLWGFGMRYAVMSGYWAARSLIDGTDYDMLWKRELKPALETSLVNRYLFERAGNAGYRYLTGRFAGGNPCGFLRKHYNYSFLKHLFLFFAKRSYSGKFIFQAPGREGASHGMCRRSMKYTTHL